MTIDFSDRPSYEDYMQWYREQFEDDLESGRAEQWYETVTDAGLRRLEESDFWKQLQASLSVWDSTFAADHENYALFGATQQPTQITKKSFDSVINKSYRWNILENENWPDPPGEPPSTAANLEERDAQDLRWWFGPHNWLTDFPDIFRTRLTTIYFDGVGYLVEKIMDLAKQSTLGPPKLRLRASHDGYHAAHLRIYHLLDTLDYENRDHVPIQAQFEIQVTTTIQDTISKLLHRVYEDWRVTGPPPDWEWDHLNPAFSVNYLGSTLHYLEGMIVMARDQRR